MNVSREITTKEYLIPGTDEDVARLYASLPERAKALQFGLVEDDVVMVDTETTGLSPATCSLLEIAAVRMQASTVVEEFHTFVDPGCTIPEEIVELTGITQADVDGAPSPREAVARFAEFAGACNLVAHNAGFDQSFIMAQAQPGAIEGDWVDTLALSQIVLPRLKSHRLIDLARAFGLHSPSHRAGDDTRCLAELWRILLAGIQVMAPGLAARIAGLSPQTKWPLRRYFAQAATEHPGVDFSLRANRAERTQAASLPPRPDADEVPLSFSDEGLIDEAFSRDGIVGRMYPGFEQRSDQLAMAHEVASSLRDGDIRVIEAGTGVGKSMAYLVPLALGARENKITMGVATKTNTLMDQLVYHELPRLREALGGLSYVPLKGYEHYLCLRKLERMARSDSDDDIAIINMVATLLSFTAQTSYGDLDALNISWGRLPRASIQASPHDCLKKRCPFFPRKCYLHGARRQATSADIVVTNHALLFRDMQADNGILPPIRHWVIDEAHSVETEARRQLSCSISSRELDVALGRIVNPKTGISARVAKQAGKHDGGQPLYGVTADIEARIGSIQLLAASFFDEVGKIPSPADRGGSLYQVSTTWVSEQMRAQGPWQTILSPGNRLADALAGLNGRLADLMSMLEQFEGEFAGLAAEITSVQSEIRGAVEALRLILDGTDEHFVYSVRIDRNPRRPSQTLEAMRLDIGESLATELYPQARSIVFTSATLATAEANPFEHFMRAIGLDRVEGKHVVAPISFDSGYDYDHNMTILLPSDVPEPNSPGYHDAFAELLYQVHVAMGGSVLTLFTNRREMEQFYQELKPRLAEAGIELAAQTRTGSTKAIRDRFLADADLSLFALKSFWEGFDAPGDTLRCVIIARLPFGRPDDPLAREREVRHGRAAWRMHSLPEAVMDLKQAAGRLIRNSTDSGWLVLADERLQTKNYKKSFLRALPTSDIRILSTAEIAHLMERSEPGLTD